MSISPPALILTHQAEAEEVVRQVYEDEGMYVSDEKKTSRSEEIRQHKLRVLDDVKGPGKVSAGERFCRPAGTRTSSLVI